MKRIIKRLEFALLLEYDRLIAAFTTSAVGVAGTLASILGLSNPQARKWLLIGSAASFVIGAFLFFLPVLKALRTSYADFWPNTKGARRWIRACLEGNYFQQCGVQTITIIGVACTDIADLFEDIVEAVVSGMSFRILMVNPDHDDVGPQGILHQFESRKQVSTKVQKPLGEKLGKLARIYEGRGKHEIAQTMLELDRRLARKDYAEHSECIRVCHDLWRLAFTEAQQRDPKTTGTIVVYLMDDLPFARQWVCGDKVVIYSLYVGYPGVGVDNPAFCYSALHGAHPHGEIGRRAAYYVEQLVKKGRVADGGSMGLERNNAAT